MIIWRITEKIIRSFSAVLRATFIMNTVICTHEQFLRMYRRVLGIRGCWFRFT